MRPDEIRVGSMYVSKAGTKRVVKSFGVNHPKIPGSKIVWCLQGNSPYMHCVWLHVFARWAKSVVPEVSKNEECT